jgi:hypothetical protein
MAHMADTIAIAMGLLKKPWNSSNSLEKWILLGGTNNSLVNELRCVHSQRSVSKVVFSFGYDKNEQRTTIITFIGHYNSKLKLFRSVVQRHITNLIMMQFNIS